MSSAPHEELESLGSGEYGHNVENCAASLWRRLIVAEPIYLNESQGGTQTNKTDPDKRCHYFFSFKFRWLSIMLRKARPHT